MKPSTRCVALVTEFEGFIPYRYDDGTGVITQGYGTTDGQVLNAWRKQYGSRVPESVARKQLLRELGDFSVGVSRALKVRVTQSMFDALTSFAYNVGLGGLRGSSALREINAGRYHRGANLLLLWIKPANVSKGLLRRRRAERKLFLSGVSALTDEEIRHVVRRDFKWLRQRNALIQKRARAHKGGWRIARRGVRFQQIRAVLKEDT